ncbi:MAG TPA: LuxR C-terminal-related transcriptional regulator [Miltoncostaeaceae bacterium]|nr:LuxR C-terminal-related transcriptional regulator [Miltoncostaeaceae bacterium]
MGDEVGALLETGQAALEAGGWEAAREAFVAALEREESPEALFGLGEALIWLGETDEAVRLDERAYAGFRRRPDPVNAALAAMNLFYLQRMSLGNVAASRGWLSRLERLVEGHDLEPLRGWALLLRAADRGETDPPAGEALARLSLEAARAGGDVDLELCALAQAGAMAVEAGRLEEGFALLDEAMAGALGGEGSRLDTILITSCTMVACCSRAAQVRRAAQWIRAGDDFVRRYGSPHVFTSCRLHSGNVLLATGRWGEAEAQLEDAIQSSRRADPALFAEALAKLAELRLAQGRVEEAAGLLDGFEDRPTSVRALAAVRLARREPAQAAAILRRRLRAIGDRCLESAALVDLLAEAEVALGARRTARSRGRRLGEAGAAAGCEVMLAYAERVLGRTEGSRGRAAAIRHLEWALDAFGRLEMPLEAGRCHLLLARAQGDREREAAVAEARSALAAFDALGAARDADAAAAFLRSLGARAGRAPGPRGLGALSPRELDVLALLGAGLSNRAIAERLYLTRKTVEHHVRSVLAKLDLANRAEAAAYAVRHLERDSATG